MSGKVFRTISFVVVLVLGLGLAWTAPTPANALPAVNPAPVQLFYVTLPEPDALTVLDAVNSDAVSPTYTYFSIAIGADATLVYYDQEENGYDSDIANPTDLYNSVTNPDGVQVWGNGEADDGCAPNIAGVALTCTDANDVLNAGDVIVPYNAVPVPLVAAPNSYVLDTFSSQSYSNNDGNTNWSGSWVETGDDGSPSSGDMYVDTGNDEMFFSSSTDANDSVDRGVNLPSGDACATLSFDLNGDNDLDPTGNDFVVEVSSNGGGSYTTLATFNDDGDDGAHSYLISAYATPNTRVRFRSVHALQSSEDWAVDDVQVEWNCSVPILFNAGDKVGASGSISMARAVWASGSDTLNAFGHEMYATADWGTAYESPVGTNTTTNAGQMFEYSALSIMASQNSTTVDIDADANGSYETQEVLNEGGSYLAATISQGARVQADKPIQVVLVTGDVGSNYASRDINLLPVNEYGSSYWSPVGKNTGLSYTPTAPVRLFLYNPSTNASIYITCERRGVANVTLGPVAVRGVVTIDLNDNQGARCYSSDSGGTATGEPIFAIGTMDTTGQAGDWSFTLFPDEFLTTDALVGLGLGKDPTNNASNQNGSPLWVTAACTSGSTYVYVDWDNDGTADLVDLNGDGDTGDTVDGISESTSNNGMSVTRLYSVRLFEPPLDTEPYDQTGARVWSRTASGVGYGGTPGCNLAVAWGQDPDRASAASPGLDVGTSIPPLRLIEGTKSLVLKTDVDGDGLLSPGDIATYIITVKNSGAVVVNNVYLFDTVPANTTYNTTTTEKDLTSNVGTGPWVAIPDDGVGTPFPLDVPGGVLLGNLDPTDTFYVRFDVTLGIGEYGEIINCDTAFTAAGELTRCATNQVASADWGDLPDVYGTSLATNGPRHSPSGLRLGTWFDREYQGQPSVGANDDDLIQTTMPLGDDEDGITPATWGGANSGNFNVMVTGGPACLNAWMDFTNGTTVGGDGDFSDSLSGYSEHIMNNVSVPNGASVQPFGVPTGVGPSGNTGPYYFRFRLSPLPCPVSPSPTGAVTGGEVEDYQFTFSPLGVTLVDFGAMCVAGQPEINWETASELTTLGFNVWRNTSDSGPQDKLNDTMIPAHPGSAQGYLYSYLDTTAVENTPYYYWLEDIDTGNVGHFTGPISVLCQAPTAVSLDSVEANPAAGLPIAALPAAGLAALALAGTVVWRKRR